MHPPPFVAPTLPEGYTGGNARSYASLTPWLPLILSGFAVVCLLAGIFFGVFALGEGFSQAREGKNVDGTGRFGAFVVMAVILLLLWGISVLCALVSLIVAVAKGYTRSLWMTPAVLFAGAPMWLGYFASLG